MIGHGLALKWLKVAWLKNFYGGLWLRNSTAAWGGSFGV